MRLYDAIGEEILPESVVIYPVFVNGEIIMRWMRVVSTHDRKVVGYRRDNGRRVTIKNYQNCIVTRADDVADSGFYDWSAQ